MMAITATQTRQFEDNKQADTAMTSIEGLKSRSTGDVSNTGRKIIIIIFVIGMDKFMPGLGRLELM